MNESIIICILISQRCTNRLSAQKWQGLQLRIINRDSSDTADVTFTALGKTEGVWCCVHISDGSNSSQETVILATKSPEERRAWIQLLRQVLYKDAGGGRHVHDICCHCDI